MVQQMRPEPYHLLTLQMKITGNRVISITECLFPFLIKTHNSESGGQEEAAVHDE